MKFGVREICDVVLRAKAKMRLGNRTFYKNEPVLYFDTLKTSSLEGAATTVYATGGRGNARLIAWEGERTLTFNMEDALLSPEGFAILSGAGLIEATESAPVYVHTTSQVEVKTANKIVLENIMACWVMNEDGSPKATGTDAAKYAHGSADIFCMALDGAGEVEVEPCVPQGVEYLDGNTVITCKAAAETGSVVLVDYYIKKTSNTKMIEITADKFAGNYYLEASTLFRRESDGVDMPAEFIIPNGKIQSNFNFAMASSGDPSTFSFVMDAFPDYTKFDPTKKVLVAIQIIESDEEGEIVEKREPCVVTFNQTATSTATGATVKVTSDSATTCAISVTGSSVRENARDNPVFNTNDELDGVNAMVLDFNMPVDAAGGRYHVKQINPALEHYFGTDFRVTKDGTDYVKNADYDIPAGGSFDLSILITENTNKATVELSKGGKVIKTYTITANVTFVA